ncbi:MAG: oligosaccharide flippase family protein [Anaerocolumna sp.]
MKRATNKKVSLSLNNVIKVALSNIFVLFAGLLTGFILPKIMGISEYGYYKAFTLYISYSSIFRFGIVDGIYLLYGGMAYDELEKNKFRFYSQFLCVFEIIISAVLITICAISLSGEYRNIFIFVAIYIWSFNMTSYYQVISQITGRFNELSLRNSLQALFTSVGVVIFWIICRHGNQDLNYESYILFYTCIQILLTIWYMYTYKDITFGTNTGKYNKFEEIITLLKVGLPLLFSNLCATLMLNVDRQFVNVLFDNEVYAKYAFAYNMLTLVTVATTAVSTVVYPILKRTDDKQLKNNYDLLEMGMLLLVFSALTIYFPLKLFINYFLPKYIDSIDIFKVIFPGLAMSSVIMVIMHNYYKTLGRNMEFFIKSVSILGMSIIANTIVYYIYGTPVSISIASIIVMLLWYLLIEAYFIKHFNLNWKRNFLYLVIMMVYFYLCTNINNNFIGLGVYLFGLVLITLLLHYKKRGNFISLILNK